jgi:hypothetical protein
MLQGDSVARSLPKLDFSNNPMPKAPFMASVPHRLQRDAVFFMFFP